MEGYSLEVNDAVLEVVNQNKGLDEKYVRLINGVSARFESGKVSAVMGASGSSKTTLISLLAGRVDPSSRTYGSILFRGEERDPKKWLSQVAYLEQDDCIVPQQTVEEYIYFSVKCRMSRKQLGGRNVRSIVGDVMKKLHIDKLKDAKLEAISGGERKRVMIAVEFAVGPDVLILDEATSGLDSHLALELVHLVKTYAAENNKIVIMIVHQPGAGLFEMFDYLLFLNRGSVIYSGPVSGCDDFLSSKGISREGSKLSKSEFLFELFSKDSVVAEIREHQKAIGEMASAAFEEGQQRTKDKPLKTCNDSVRNYSVCLRNSLLLVKRQILHDWKTWGILKRWTLEGLVFGVMFWSVILRFIQDAFTGLTYKNLPIDRPDNLEDLGVTEVYNLFRNALAEEVRPNLDEAMKWSHYSVVAMATCVSFSTLLDDTSYISRETAKGTYSIPTLYLSVLMVEYFFTLIRCGMFFLMFVIFGYGGGYTPSLLTYVFAGTFMIVLFTSLIKCITASRVGRMILLGITFMLAMFGRPLFLSFVLGAITAVYKNPSTPTRIAAMLKVAVHARHVFVFWPHLFLEGFMGVRFVRRILLAANDKFTPVYKVIVGKAYSPSFPVDDPSDAESLHKSFITAAAEEVEFSEYWLLLGLGLSVTVVILLSMHRLFSRFSPQLRLRLKATD